MRLTPLAPDKLTGEQLELHKSIDAGVKKHLQGFISQRADGAMIGPFNPMINFPQFGKPVWDFTMALIENTTLPKKAHEVAILVTGAHFRSRYELYAHEHVADKVGLSASKIATITAGCRPADLSDEEGIAYDLQLIVCPVDDNKF